MQVTDYHTSDIFAELQPEWNALLKHNHHDNIFSTWEWQKNWWQAYQPGELWIATIRTDDQELIAIAPWFIETAPDGDRVVRSIGCVDVTDYVDAIIHPDYRDAVYDALAQHLHDKRALFDRINLCNIPEASPTLKTFPEALAKKGFEMEVVFQEVCPVIPLPEDYEDYLASLDKKQRHELRRKVRRAEAEAEISWYIVGKEHNLEEELEAFLILMAASQEQKAEFLQDPKNRAFFEQVMPSMLEQGWLQLSFLIVNGERTAAYLNFDYNDRILVYNSGLMPGDAAYLSPGIVLLVYNIQNAIQHKRKVYDFLRGDETYKYRMGASDTKVFKLVGKYTD